MPREPEDATRPHSARVEEDLELLLERTATGDTLAFEQLFDQVSGRVHGLALRIVRDPARAEEITQEALLDVWRRAASFDRSRGTALSWVLTISHRRAVDAVRTSQSQSDRDRGYESRHTVPLPDPTAEDATDRVRSATVHHAVAELPTGQRRAVELAYFGGRTHREVAAELGIPLGTAKTRVRDGLHRLRKVLRKEGDQGEW